MTTVAGYVSPELAAAARPPLTPAQKTERLAFTFCKMGTIGLLAWLVTPPIFVIIVASAAIVLYGRALAQGLDRARCILRYPRLIMGFWAAVVAATVTWLVWLS
jgi:hypothetical protein